METNPIALLPVLVKTVWIPMGQGRGIRVSDPIFGDIFKWTLYENRCFIKNRHPVFFISENLNSNLSCYLPSKCSLLHIFLAIKGMLT